MKKLVKNYNEIAQNFSKELTAEDKNDLDRIACNSFWGECYGFYHTFLYLADKCFLKTDIAMIGYEQFSINDRFFSACVVNGAFAAETAMKYLLLKTEGTFPETHELKTLFAYLPTDHRDRMIHKLRGIYEIKDCDFDKELESISNAFVEWRYTCELQKQLSINVFFKAFVCTVCNYALAF